MNVLTDSIHCWNQHGTTISLFSRQFEVNWSWKKSPSVWYEILRLFVNALTADDKYSGSNMQNLPQQFQTPLSQKQKTFSGFFIAFRKCTWNLEHFQKKDEYPSLIISGIIETERRGYLNVWKVLLQNTIC